jgi:hypothetical protein
MTPLHLILMILAVICLLLAALGVSTPRGNLMAAGLFFWALAVTITGFK